MKVLPNQSGHPFTGIVDREFQGFASADTEWTNAHASFLSSLLQEEKKDLIGRSRHLTLKLRDHLFRVGEPSSKVYIVGSGCIRLTQVSAGGKEAILWFNFPGEIFGIAELWSGTPRQVNAVANQPSEVYSIHRRDFTDFLRNHPEAAMKAIGILSARVRSLGALLTGLASDDVETRIARLLTRLAAAVSSDASCQDVIASDEFCVNVRMTHQDIAGLIGASRQTVTSTLIRLRRVGAIRNVDHHIHVARPARLCSLLRHATKQP